MSKEEIKKLGIIQLAILTNLKDKPMKSSEILRILKNLGLRARSSFYAALHELEERGYVSKRMFNEDFYYYLTERGKEFLSRLPALARETFLPALHLYSFIMDKLGLYIEEEIEESYDELIKYKEFLLRELEKVENKLKKWKRINVE